MDLFARTLPALDWDVVLAALAGQARTTRGRARGAQVDFAPDAAAARARYEAVAEVLAIEDMGEDVPVGAVLDVASPVERAGRGQVLDGEELRDIGTCLFALTRLSRWIEARADEAPRLWELAAPIEIDPDLAETLGRAFDETGALSAEAWPELADLRERLQFLRARIRSTLDELVRGDSLAHALRDRYVTEREGRFVLPIKANARRGVGIVHGTSQSGETVFVEPAQVVEHTNESKETEAAIEREERRIYAWLSVLVGQHAASLERALDAALQVDLACARGGLGRTLDGVIPRVGEQGVMQIRLARHPVLALRGVDVVPNDLSVDSAHPALVLTGPNTGGKTVALKTLGLCALLVRAGIPIPAHSARVDFFERVVADVGDLQDVREDLSTFSGHLLVLDQTLREAGPGTLALLDELGSGTDPAQGAALARAVLEALVDRGARVAVTTHYAELRALGASDERFLVAALQVEDGRPTYHLAPGHAGESHALSVARRLGMSGSVLARARALLDEGTRRMSDLIEQLERERSVVGRQARALAQEREEIEALQAETRARAERLDQRQRTLERDLAAGLGARLRAREREVKTLIAALQADPDLRHAGDVLARIRQVGREIAPAPEPRPAVRPVKRVAVGDRVLVPSLGRQGVIVALLPRDRVEVDVGRMRMKLRRSELGLGDGPPTPPPAGATPPPKKPKRAPAKAELRGVRTPGNTLDLRGERVEAALARTEAWLDQILLRGESVAFVLHGHGTGALKQAIREWLPSCPYANSWRPAREDEGGDAFTIIGLA